MAEKTQTGDSSKQPPNGAAMEKVATEGNLETNRGLLTQKTQVGDAQENEEDLQEVEFIKPTKGKELAYLDDKPLQKEAQTTPAQTSTPNPPEKETKGGAPPGAPLGKGPPGGNAPGKGPPGGGPPGRGRGPPAAGPRAGYMDLYKYSPKRDKVIVILGIFFSIAGGATQPFYSVIIGYIVKMFDPQIDNEEKSTMLREFIWVICAIAITVFFTSYCGYSMMQISAERLSFKLRARYLASLMRQEISYFEKQKEKVEAIPSKMAEYFVHISVGSGEKFGQLVATIGAILSGAIIAFVSCPYYALALFCYFPIATLVSKKLSGNIKSAVMAKMRMNGMLGAFTEEMLSSLKLIISFGKEKYKLKEYNGIATKAFNVAKSSAIKMGMSMGCMFGLICGFACFSWSVGFAYIKYEIDNPFHGRPTAVYDIVQCYQAMMYCMFSVMGIMSNLPAIFAALSAGQTVLDLIERKPEIVSKENSVSNFKILNGIQFNNVHFRYPTAQEHVADVFQGLSFTIKSGTTTAIVGPSGSGKSTIVQMINRFYDPKEGSIQYGDTDLKDIELKSLRESIGYVGQEPVLIVGSIKENIMYGNKDATEKDIQLAIKQANAEFIFEMEKGLETYVGSSTVLNLSGGQKQRIAIARALIKKPQILVLDEATSALDPKSEGEVQAAILKISKEMAGNLTIIMIAHRLQTIQSAANLLFIESPKVMRAGKKGTKQYDAIMSDLKRKNYAHQVESDDEDEEEKQSNASNRKAENLLNLEHSYALSHASHYSNRSMQMDEESKRESKKIQKELQRLDQLTEQEKAAEEKAKAEQNKLQYRTTFTSPNAGWCRIFANYKPCYMIFVMCFMAIINAFCMPVVAFCVIKLQFTYYSKYSGNTEWESEGLRYILFLGCWIFVQVLVKGIEKSIFSAMGEKMTLLIRLSLIEEIMHKQISWFDREDRAPGIITKTISGDIALLNGMTAEMLVTLFELAFVMALGMIGGIYFQWQAALVCVICSPIMIAAMYLSATMKWGNRGGKKMDNSEQLSNYDKSNALLSDVIINYRTVVSLGQKNVDSICNKFEELLVGPMEDVIKKSNKAGLYYGLAQSGRSIYISIVFIINIELLVVAWGYSQDDVFTATYLLFFTLMGLGNQASNVPSITKAKQAAVPIFSIIDEPSDLDIRKPVHRNHTVVENGLIEFKDVTFNYPTRAQKVMDNFNLEIPAGAKIALVGHSGCGKSTLTNILLRFYNIEEGQGNILIDGVQLDQYDVHALREQCGYVMQEPVLFNTTIKKNILFGKPDATDEEVYIAALKANALQFIETNTDDLTKEQSEQKLIQDLDSAFGKLKTHFPKVAALHSEIIQFADSRQSTASQIKQMILDLLNSANANILNMAESNPELFKNSIIITSNKHGVSWADIILRFEWQESLDRVMSEFGDEFKQLVQKTLAQYPDLEGVFEVDGPSNMVQQASNKGLKSVDELADFLESDSMNYKMKNVKDRYNKLMHMAIDKKRDPASGKFTLSEGFDKDCGSKGSKLSGGQKQRVAIARALIKDPRILILDEATSALDERSQEIVQQALDRAMEGRTSIVIAHRLSTIRNCDILFVLGKGHVLEYGTYDELANDPESHFNVLKAGMEN